MAQKKDALEVMLNGGKVTFSGPQDVLPVLTAYADYINGKATLETAYEKTATETVKFFATRKAWTPIHAIDAAEKLGYVSKKDAKALRLRGIALAVCEPLRGKSVDNPEKGIKRVTLEYDAETIPTLDKLTPDAFKTASENWKKVQEWKAQGFSIAIRFRKDGKKNSKGKRITKEDAAKAIETATENALSQSAPQSVETSARVTMYGRVLEIVSAYTATHTDDKDAVSLESMIKDALQKAQTPAKDNGKGNGKGKGKGKSVSIPDKETLENDALDTLDALNTLDICDELA